MSPLREKRVGNLKKTQYRSGSIALRPHRIFSAKRESMSLAKRESMSSAKRESMSLAKREKLMTLYFEL